MFSDLFTASTHDKPCFYVSQHFFLCIYSRKKQRYFRINEKCGCGGQNPSHQDTRVKDLLPADAPAIWSWIVFCFLQFCYIQGSVWLDVRHNLSLQCSTKGRKPWSELRCMPPGCVTGFCLLRSSSLIPLGSSTTRCAETSREDMSYLCRWTAKLPRIKTWSLCTITKPRPS